MPSAPGLRQITEALVRIPVASTVLIPRNALTYQRIEPLTRKLMAGRTGAALGLLFPDGIICGRREGL